MLKRKHCSAKSHAIKNSPPWGFTKIEYLEKTGNQFIDTNYGGKCLTITVMSLESIGSSNPGSGWNGWGASESFQNSRGSVWTIRKNKDANTCWLYLYACWDIQPKEPIPLGTPIEITHWHGENSKIGNRIRVSETNDRTDTSYATALNSSKTYKLFSRDTPYNCEKLWSFNLSSDGNTIRRMLPFLSETGTPCLFDFMTRKSFYNAGTGQFNYPTTSTTYSLRRPQAEYAKMTDTGVHKIYHTPIGYEGSLEDYAIENGYKQLIETESPNEEGKYYSFKWVETDDTLMTEWFEVDPPQEEMFEENLDNLIE